MADLTNKAERRTIAQLVACISAGKAAKKRLARERLTQEETDALKAQASAADAARRDLNERNNLLAKRIRRAKEDELQAEGVAASARRQERAARAKALAERAKREMLEGHRPLLVEAATSYRTSRISASRADAEALAVEQRIAIGEAGLHKAIENYDPSKGAAFSTYAWACIEYEILGYLKEESGDQIHIPAKRQKQAKEFLEKQAELSGRLGRQCTNEEVRKELGIKEHDFKLIEKIIAIKTRIALDEAMGDGDSDQTLADLIADDADTEAEALASVDGQRDWGAELDSALGAIDPDDRRIVELLYGLGGQRCYTYDEVASLVFSTPYYVKATEREVLSQLKNDAPHLFGVLGERKIVANDWIDGDIVHNDSERAVFLEALLLKVRLSKVDEEVLGTWICRGQEAQSDDVALKRYGLEAKATLGQLMHRHIEYIAKAYVQDAALSQSAAAGIVANAGKIFDVALDTCLSEQVPPRYLCNAVRGTVDDLLIDAIEESFAF